MPIWRRICKSRSRSSAVTSSPNMDTDPRLGLSESKSSRKSEVLPDPDGPVKKWNEPGEIEKVKSFRISGPCPYLKPTFSNFIKPELRESPCGYRYYPLPTPMAALGQCFKSFNPIPSSLW